MTTLLETNSLCRNFGGLKAVDHVSFQLPTGGICALIGPNGAGKTTLFSLLSGTLRPTTGAIFYDGSDITKLAPHHRARRGIGRTFQIAATFNSMNVRENIETALLAAEQSPASWADIAERLGLSAHAETPVPSLAYGDIKRVELAMALAAHPPLLLLDEPTAGVAEDERKRIMQVIVELARTMNTTVLFTEHDMDAVFSFAERVLVMDQGKIIADGKPDDIRRDPTVKAVYLGDTNDA